MRTADLLTPAASPDRTEERPGPGSAPLRTSAVVFAYEEAANLRRCLPSLLESAVDEILVMYGGSDGSRAYLESIHDPRLLLEHEPVPDREVAGLQPCDRAGPRRHRVPRLGRCLLPRVHRRPSPFPVRARRRGRLPRVVPTNVRNLVSRLGQTLWDVHDRQIRECAERGLPVHGGELQAVRRTLLEPIDGVVNEDAYLCLRASERGYRVVYDRESVVRNTVPETLVEFLLQRTRVNYGHRQLAEGGLDPSTLDRLVWVRPDVCLAVLSRAVADRPSNAVRLPLLAVLELVALARGNRDFSRGIDHSRWSLVRSGKGGVFAAPSGDATAFTREK